MLVKKIIQWFKLHLVWSINVCYFANEEEDKLSYIIKNASTFRELPTRSVPPRIIVAYVWCCGLESKRVNVTKITSSLKVCWQNKVRTEHPKQGVKLLHFNIYNLLSYIIQPLYNNILTISNTKRLYGILWDLYLNQGIL